VKVQYLFQEDFSKMNKTELVAAIAEKTELSKKDAEKALKAFTDVVAEELKKGEKIQLVGFGTFEVAERPARDGRNPLTGKAMKIPASKSPKFKAGNSRIQLTLNCFLRIRTNDDIPRLHPVWSWDVFM
jgi:DNA-binding protein HU-beta